MTVKWNILMIWIVADPLLSLPCGPPQEKWDSEGKLGRQRSVNTGRKGNSNCRHDGVRYSKGHGQKHLTEAENWRLGAQATLEYYLCLSQHPGNNGRTPVCSRVTIQCT